MKGHMSLLMLNRRVPTPPAAAATYQVLVRQCAGAEAHRFQTRWRVKVRVGCLLRRCVRVA